MLPALYPGRLVVLYILGASSVKVASNCTTWTLHGIVPVIFRHEGWLCLFQQQLIIDSDLNLITSAVWLAHMIMEILMHCYFTCICRAYHLASVQFRMIFDLGGWSMNIWSLMYYRRGISPSRIHGQFTRTLACSTVQCSECFIERARTTILN